MNLTGIPSISMSDYPASSDPASQMQVLSERKGELTEQMQDVEENSNLDENRKQAMTEHLQQASDNVSARIRNEQRKKDDNKTLDDKRTQTKQFEQKQLEKQQIGGNRIDVHA
jgi:hypothetical protein